MSPPLMNRICSLRIKVKNIVRRGSGLGRSRSSSAQPETASQSQTRSSIQVEQNSGLHRSTYPPPTASPGLRGGEQETEDDDSEGTHSAESDEDGHPSFTAPQEAKPSPRRAPSPAPSTSSHYNILPAPGTPIWDPFRIPESESRPLRTQWLGLRNPPPGHVHNIFCPFWQPGDTTAPKEECAERTYTLFSGNPFTRGGGDYLEDWTERWERRRGRDESGYEKEEDAG